MDILDFNESGSSSVFLGEGDSLDAIPELHSRLLSHDMRQLFANPMAILHDAVNGNPFPEMKRWLRSLIDSADWRLEIHHGAAPMTGRADYYFTAENVRGASIFPPKPYPAPNLPETLRDFYSLVDIVDWSGCFCGGSLYGVNQHMSMVELPRRYSAGSFDAESAFMWGDSPCGDMLVWLVNGTCGWISPGSAAFYPLGTVADAIDWIFGQLNSDICPQCPRN